MSVHTVQRGETLSGIARQNNTSVAALQRLNGIADPDSLAAGQRLIVAAPPAPPAAPAAAQAGQAAARTAAPAAPGAPVAPCPKKPLFSKRAGGDDNVSALYVTADGEAKRQGLLGQAKGEAGVGMTKMDHSGHLGNRYVGGSHKMEILTAEAKAAGGIVHGVGGTASAKATMVEQEASLFAGKDKNSPWAEAGGAYSLMQAEAKADGLIGSDGRRAGIALGAKAGAAAASGDLKGEINIPIPFTNHTITLRGKGGASAGSVGAGASAHAFKDLETGRYHMGVAGEAAALLGLKADLDLSVGPRYTSRERNAGP
ncbi:LysM peptidoglycan-binding domain-containing protein [Azospirillum doebereinerae]|uniref:LysM domain-containing protein n=1 Tax=Azospirillum doebereinerae TaxID=92933 RepID=A0A433JE69_9PROT|nr:LysM domain-containing protein [Azospirillum doebereinerae]MCG5239247.1 LysM peptidoglycan-binding domain-containing protein [Azospirillum doebereinerae]RUQ75121.1 LysM domain-containing protein [Azospirillum doebereinerae]